jgi:hypothetical protein
VLAHLLALNEPIGAYHNVAKKYAFARARVRSPLQIGHKKKAPILGCLEVGLCFGGRVEAVAASTRCFLRRVQSRARDYGQAGPFTFRFTVGIRVAGYLPSRAGECPDRDDLEWGTGFLFLLAGNGAADRA